MGRKSIYSGYIKRILDVALSAAAIVVLSPILGITAVLVRIMLGSPVLFTQPRPGRYEKIFRLYKFRSMTDEKGPDGRLLPDAKRLTRFGKFLRASSLDELPELFNILKGDMSIVGPRPLSIYYLPHYPARHRRRGDVRPGLTGLAQISGRNSLPWDERFDKDIEYVEKVSFFMDLSIILKTVLKVAQSSGVSVRGTAKVKDYGPYSIIKEEGAGNEKMKEMTYSEIGSYFWLEDEEAAGPARDREAEPACFPLMDDGTYTFSGRNAIDLALRDILAGRDIDKVYVPSYGCVSMIQPFVDRGMKTEFYTVDRKDGKFTYKLPKVDGRSLVLVMSYFGLDSGAAIEIAEEAHRQGAAVIEDITHSLLSEGSTSSVSDYVIASLRKWFAIPTGGWAGKRYGKFADRPHMDSNAAVEGKIAAMKEKYDYISGRICSKEDFLLENAKFDNDLIHVDRDLMIDDRSLSILRHTDIDGVKIARRDNVRALAEGLKDLEGTVMEIPRMDFDRVTPLFLPVFMKTEERDDLRRYLIGRGIYCPVHWPEVMGAPVGVRANELSLICDQRYGRGDMEAIATCIHEWYDLQKKKA